LTFFLYIYEIWKVLVSLAKKKIIANFHVLGLFIPSLERKKIRLSCGVAGLAVSFWTKFEAQLAQ
jgi:hypothetical protein